MKYLKLLVFISFVMSFSAQIFADDTPYGKSEKQNIPVDKYIVTVECGVWVRSDVVISHEVAISEEGTSRVAKQNCNKRLSHEWKGLFQFPGENRAYCTLAKSIDIPHDVKLNILKIGRQINNQLLKEEELEYPNASFYMFSKDEIYYYDPGLRKERIQNRDSDIRNPKQLSSKEKDELLEIEIEIKKLKKERQAIKRSLCEPYYPKLLEPDIIKFHASLDIRNEDDDPVLRR